MQITSVLNALKFYYIYSHRYIKIITGSELISFILLSSKLYFYYLQTYVSNLKWMLNGLSLIILICKKKVKRATGLVLIPLSDMRHRCSRAAIHRDIMLLPSSYDQQQLLSLTNLIINSHYDVARQVRRYWYRKIIRSRKSKNRQTIQWPKEKRQQSK
jgi:hypothetical protein